MDGKDAAPTTPRGDLYPPLEPTRLGPYTLERELGRGGMATVYLAADPKHNRRVAVKVLHAELAAMLGPERFLQEIRVTANLQHPHILGLIDSGVFGDDAGDLRGRPYYVMPYVEGETLRHRLDRERQLPMGDAVRIACEAADALNYAHAHSVVHRDIKPENILLQHGHALVADFGIALAVEQAGGTRMTQTGLSLGTPQYMAPEQALGERSVDLRADIYALGAVLYEMLVGAPPFTGPTAQAIVAKVLTEHPPAPSVARDTVPPEVDSAVLTALSKLPADRFGSAAEFAAALSGKDTGPMRRAVRPATATPRRSMLHLGGAALALLVAAGVGWGLHAALAPRATPPRVRRALLPMSPEFDPRGSDLTVSADGSTLAAVDAEHISLRRVDQTEFTPIPGAATLLAPSGGVVFLSADGERIGFVRGRDLVVERLDGSEQSVIQAVSPGGGTFVDDQHVVVIDTGGLARYTLRSAQRDALLSPPVSWRLYQPHLLPDGKHVLVTIVAGNLATARILSVNLVSHRVDTVAVGEGMRPQYADGWLYYARSNGALTAAPFDPVAVRPLGGPVSTGISVVVSREGRAGFAAGHGLLVYGERPTDRLVALGPGASRTQLFDRTGTFHNPRVSPDGRRILFDRDSGTAAGRDVWVLEKTTGTLSRVTTIGDAHDAVWTPDGRQITYLSFRHPKGSVITVSVDGAPGERVFAVKGTPNPGMWLPDGSAYIAGVSTLATNSDLYLFPASGGAPEPILVTPFDEHSPAVSPDGHWLAYSADETGTTQVYVRAFRGDSRRTLVSTGEGAEPVWSRDGKTLWYVEHRNSASRLIAATLSGDTPPRVVSRTIMVDPLRYEPVGNHANWDLGPDGRAVVVEPVEESRRLIMVFDWTPALAER